MRLCKNLPLHGRKDRGDHDRKKEEQKEKSLPDAQRKHGDSVRSGYWRLSQWRKHIEIFVSSRGFCLSPR